METIRTSRAAITWGFSLALSSALAKCGNFRAVAAACRAAPLAMMVLGRIVEIESAGCGIGVVSLLVLASSSFNLWQVRLATSGSVAVRYITALLAVQVTVAVNRIKKPFIHEDFGSLNTDGRRWGKEKT